MVQRLFLVTALFNAEILANRCILNMFKNEPDCRKKASATEETEDIVSSNRMGQTGAKSEGGHRHIIGLF